MPETPTAAGPISDQELVLLRERLRRATARICRGPLVAHIEDIVQTALLRVAEGVSRGEVDREVPSSYLARAAYSILVDEVRRQRRRQEVPMTEVPGLQLPPHAFGNHEQAGTGRDIRRGVRDCLMTLVRARRLAVTLHLQGHSVREAAQLLDWLPKQVENLVYRGLADLRRCLAGKGITP